MTHYLLGEKSGVARKLIRFDEKRLRNKFASPLALVGVESVALISGGQPPKGSRPSPREVGAGRNGCATLVTKASGAANR